MERKNTFDGGAAGTSITVGNSGGVSGDAFTAVESTATYSAAQAHTGTLAMKPPSTAVSGLARWAVPGDRNVAFRGYVFCTAAHTVEYHLFQTRTATPGNTATVMFNGGNALRLRTNADGVNPFTAASTFPLNQWVRVEALIESGVGLADGRARVAYYLGDATTPVEDSGWLTGLRLRGDEGATANAVIGKISANAYAGDLWLDSVVVRSGVDYTGNLIGPPVVATAHQPFRMWIGGDAYTPVSLRLGTGTGYTPITTL